MGTALCPHRRSVLRGMCASISVMGRFPRKGLYVGLINCFGSVQENLRTLPNEDAELLEVLRDAAAAMPVYDRL